MDLCVMLQTFILPLKLIQVFFYWCIKNVKENDCVMVNKGFAISEKAADFGVVVNRPPMGNVEQFTPGEVEANFKIATLHIHVERWIGRLQNFCILTKYGTHLGYIS